MALTLSPVRHVGTFASLITRLARPIVADARPRGARPGVYQALPGRDRRITLDRDLDPIDTSAGYIRRSGRKRQNGDCSQTRAASCRNLKWFWRQITRQESRKERRKTDSVRQMTVRTSPINNMRLFTVAVCAVRHTSRRRAQVPEARARLWPVLRKNSIRG
jgi:hypothetical protein